MLVAIIIIFHYILISRSERKDSTSIENRVKQEHAIQRVKIKFHDFRISLAKLQICVNENLRNYDKKRKRKILER